MGEQMITVGVRLYVSEVDRLDQERIAWAPWCTKRSPVARALILTAIAMFDAGIVSRHPEALQGLHEQIRLRPLTPLTGGKQLQLWSPLAVDLRMRA